MASESIDISEHQDGVKRKVVRSSLLDIAKMAGLLEGEGCFSWRRKCLGIVISSTDKDVVEWVADRFGKRCRGPYPSRGGKAVTYSELARYRPFYVTEVSGGSAAAWMMTIYPLLGQRRQAKIRQILPLWREYKQYYKTLPSCTHRKAGRYSRLCWPCHVEARRNAG